MECNLMNAREILKRIYMRLVSMNCIDAVQKQIIDKCRMLIKQALSKPPRNCDVGTPEEQRERFHTFCQKGKMPRLAESAYCAHECSCRDAADCKFAWAQAPYAQEGAAK